MMVNFIRKNALILIFILLILGLIGGGLVFFKLIDQEILYEGVVLGKVDREPFKFDELVKEEPVNREFSIFAPQINVNAPIYSNIDGSNEKNYLPRVLRGVAHYRKINFANVQVDGTLPGEQGNIFLFGHSQIPGGGLSDYQGVFNNLEELVLGDIIKIYYQEKEYRYQVKEGKVVNKTAVEYLAHTDIETLTLMSCWPLGLDWKRYVIRAERVN